MKLKVSNLPASPSEEELHTLFSQYGPCTMAWEDELAIVTYTDPQHAQKAVTLLDHSLFGGKPLCLNVDSAPVTEIGELQEEGKGRGRSRSRSPAKETVAVVVEEHSETKLPAESPKLAANQAPPDPSPDQHVDSMPLSQENPLKAETQSFGPAKTEKKRSKPDIAVEEDGSKFKILSRNKRNEDLSSWKCLACNRKIQKKSVKTHIASKTHKQHIS